ncbi:DUF2059 domain-containing protein [Chryseobacterium limigenitum]|uniref:DUF2059 domain-containing protein n=1 Tax=Chryseobacterium limigenitum TaxID=1612149 RepID=A0A1K2IUY7_9FLAO|nr:DUF2059 domain-containing protein [Chryseobacterium limigenitum]SFZ96175.1 hypothetical protein SAMN05216324_11686 [Chryseobacterium limigenitum]
MKKAFCFAMFMVGVFAYSQTKQDKVKELISLSGVFPISKEAEKEFIFSYKKKYSHVPDSAWKSIEQKVNIDELINKVVDIYANKFNEKDIDQLLIFYKSEVGKKLIQNSPGMITEIQESTNNWGMKATQTINNDLEKMGYLQSPPPPMAPTK